VNYNPFDNSGSFVTPTACSASSASETATHPAPVYSTATHPAPVYTTSASGSGSSSDCAKTCVEKYRTCQSDLSNTRAQCASDLASCVNYNPFDNSGSFVTPTACSASASSTAAVTTSASATIYTTYCPAPTTLTYGEQTITVTKPQTVTITSCPGGCSKPAETAPAYTTPAVGGQDDCAKKCVEAYRTCQSDLSNTRAQCASELASCVNYNPFDNSGSFVTPTACSASASSTAAVTTSAAPPAYTTGAIGGQSDCAKKCVEAYRTCQSDLSNTRAQCASDLASCVNYNPFDNSGSFVTPTACSASSTAAATASGSSVPMASAPATYPGSPAPMASSPATYAPGSPAPAPSAPSSASGCAETCVSAYRTCQSDLSNTRAQCASTLASCIGYNPFDNSGSFVTPTACSSAGASKPTMAGNGTMMGTASATYSAPAQYTGGASLMSGCGSLMAVAAGAVGLLL